MAGGAAGKEKIVEGAIKGGKKVIGILGDLLKSGKKAEKVAAEELLRGLPAEEVARVGGQVRIRPGELYARGASKAGVPGRGGLLNTEATAQRLAFERLQATPRGRRTLASITGEFPELPTGATPGFRDFRTQALLAKGKSLEPRGVVGTARDVATGAAKFAAARPKTALVLGGLGGLTGLGLTAGMLGGADEGDQLSEAEILGIIGASGVGQSTEDYLRSLAEQRIAGLQGQTAIPPELQAQLDARQLQYENALIDANRRYLEAIGAGATVPAASMAAYGQGAEAAQAAAEADTGTAVSGLTPVSGGLASAPELLQQEGARQAALEQIIANTAAGSDQRARDLAALAGAESVANLRSNYENLLLAQQYEDFRNRQAAEQAIQEDLFGALSKLGLERVQAGQGRTAANYVDIVNQYVIEYESLSDTQKAALAQQSGITDAADYATVRLRQEYGV